MKISKKPIITNNNTNTNDYTNLQGRIFVIAGTAGAHFFPSTGSLIVPLSADFTQADVQDNQMYPTIISSLPQGVRYMAADSGYDDDHKLYNLSIDKGFELVCPVSEI